MNRSADGYDWLAPKYQWLEWLMFGSRLQAARVAALPWLKDHINPKNILVTGDGDGRLLAALLKCFPHARYTSLDFSAEMLTRQQRLVGHQTRVGWIQADATGWTPTETYDLWVTAFFLDCFDRPGMSELVARWTTRLNPDGMIYLVDFIPPENIESTWQRMLAKVRMAAMRGLFQFVTRLPKGILPDIQRHLDESGWKTIECSHHVQRSVIVAVMRQDLGLSR